MSASEIHEDDYLRLPLAGVQLIEASAGTGKTFTLTTLFTRLVVEGQLRIGQVLAVTFTEAATQELRRRIRERLELAWRIVGTEPGKSESHEVVLTRAILERHLQGSEESAAQLARRLRIAAEEVDLAAIFTIHGFCARVLSEHALDSGCGFDAPELLANLRPLRAGVAADLWRKLANDAATMEPLAALWSGPDALADDLRVLLSDLPLLPAADDNDDDPQITFNAATTQLIDAIGQHIDDARAAIEQAFATKVIDGRRVRRASFDKAFDELLNGRRAGFWVRTDTTHLQKLLPGSIAGYCKQGQEPGVPASPLFDSLQAWCGVDDAMETWRARQRIGLLHRIGDEAKARVALLMQQRRQNSFDGLIDGVADALDGPQRQRLVAQLRDQYRVALVDEFQDTDARQWAIFHRVFGDCDEVRAAGQVPALFLIGDPKQAIYRFRGGDVHTYLSARRHARTAPSLRHNFRSRPAVLRAIQVLYAGAGEDAFLEHGIAFEPVLPGGKRDDGDYQRGGAPAPALTVRRVRGEEGTPLNADRSREAVTAACVADIHRVLSDSRAGHALIDGEPVQPGDIAVLVRTHREATRVQQALAAAGIAAVAAGKQSLYATPEAQELRLLLLALLQPADEGRLRAVLATVLLGFDAAAVANLDHDGEALRAAQDALLQWRQRWQRGGPFALVSDLCASHAERLLLLLDGERRVTNYLQLGEQLQEAAESALGLHGLLDWLQARIVRADEDDETQLLRLESDARRVQIVTLHKSKGLEYPLVYLPFVGIGTKPPNTARHHVVHDGVQRVLHWKVSKDDAWADASRRAAREDDAEAARLLYVGLTRAVHALWVAAGDLRGFSDTRLAPLLSDLEARDGSNEVCVVEGPAEDAPPRLPPERATSAPSERIAKRRIVPDWWVYSFTQLARADGQHATDAGATGTAGAAADETMQAEDEASTLQIAQDPFDPRFSGSRFGNVLHEAMEKAAFPAWACWRPGDAAPTGEDAVLRDALHAGGYAEADLDDGIGLLTSLVGRTLTVALPEGDALHALGEHQRSAEIEFHFAMQPTSVPALMELLHAHGVARGRRGFGLRHRLEGLMTGKIDLTYVRDGRWFVLDYKSNRLPRYDSPELAAAMAHGEYDLQALIYTLDLHRWLRFRLGDAYDYARDFGGIRYLFCRGLDPLGDASAGVFQHRFAAELVHALDALFAGHAQGAAA